jgi:signal transduction histidine kinase/CheY-like chemotaxis protein
MDGSTIDDATAGLASLPREELVAKARALQTVLRVVHDVTRARSLTEVAERFVEAVAAYTRFPSVVVWRYLPARDGFDILAQRGFDESKFASRRILPWRGSLSGLAVERRQVLTTDDIASDDRVDPEMRAALSSNDYTSGACVPILCGNDVMGSFNLVYPRGTALAQDERGLLETLATSLGFAMARQISAEQDHGREVQALRAQQLESLGVLAGGIAHDFNNLLTGIVGNVDLARVRVGGAHDAEIVDLLSEALAAAERARKLVSQLLTFSRGGAPSLRVTGELGTLIQEVASFAAHGTSIRLEFEIEEPLGGVEVDMSQIGQVFQNLVLNACQASARGGTVTIRARRTSRDGSGWVVVEVVDRGSGIALEHLPHIFEPFYSARAGGTGLGLAVSHSIVHRHGGRLSVKSEVGHGSVFTVELPMSHRAPPPSSGVVAGVAPCAGRALVLDDEDAVRRVAERLLKRLGFEVECARHGDEAISLARRATAEHRPFHVALLDLTIVGGRGGSEVAPDIRRESPGIRLVASSGYTADDTNVGWDATLPKPYTLVDLSATLERALASARR